MRAGQVWAPLVQHARVVVDGETLAMERDGAGVWHPPRDLHPGEAYGYLLDDDERVLPDPRSRWQPDGVEGRSSVIDLGAHQWHDADWSPPPWGSAVVYELHVGTFSERGTFLGVIDHLDHLVSLGVTHVELMPIAAAPGRFGWGYDGVALWGPHPAYGSPDELRQLVDACHQAGLAVIVDVVMNHVGPAGEHLREFGPYFTDRHKTPWGDAFNVDGPECDQVREFLLGSAEQWLVDHHLDGLRVDAAHAIVDTSAVHLLEELPTRVDALSARLGRHIVTIAEWDRDDPRIVTDRDAGGYGFTAQWADDLHHALHGTLTGERLGYYVDFDGGAPQVADVLSHVYAFRDTWSKHHRRHLGRDPGDLPRDRFVVAVQNHDQVGNRARGDRLQHQIGTRRTKTAAALVLLSPQTPMLFQGEEWAASTPFPYFADHDGELADAIRRGRLEEFVNIAGDDQGVVDPISPDTVELARLRWVEADRAEHGEMLAWYRRLLELRRAWPGGVAAPDVREERGLVTMQRSVLHVVANLSVTDSHTVDADHRLMAATDGVKETATGWELEPESCVVLGPTSPHG